MPKKITNPLRSGLPSKIYLTAYGKPTSGYEIAQRVYSITPTSGKRAQIPPTAKIYGWLKRLEKAGLIKKHEDGYLSQAPPLIKEIEKVLEVHSAKGLTALEKKILLRVVDSKEFRFYAGERMGKINLLEDVDAARELTELLIVPPLLLKGLKAEVENQEILELPRPTTIVEFNRLWDKDIVSVLEEKIKESYEKIRPALEKGPVVGAAHYQAKKVESSLMNDMERIKSRAKEPEGLLALKFVCVPKALSEEIENLSPVAVAMKRFLDSLRKRVQKK